jgi:hypothetical protein
MEKYITDQCMEDNEEDKEIKSRGERAKLIPGEEQPVDYEEKGEKRE